MARPESGAVPGRPHHISNIAHLFLQEDSDLVAGNRTSNRGKIAVASPGPSPVSAFAAAGLALGAPGPSVLREDRVLRWSAGTFLGRAGRVVPVREGVAQDDSNTWTITDGPSSGRDVTGGPTPPGHVSGDLCWSHLGCLGPGELGHLESLSAVGSLVDPSLNRSGALVWCLLAKQAGFLEAAYTLGRLVELIHPGRIWILVFPDSWGDAGRPGWLAEISRRRSRIAGDEILDRCLHIAGRVCDGIPLHADRVGGQDNLASSFEHVREKDSFWRQAALDVTAGLGG